MIGSVIAEIDKQIASLQQARAILIDVGESPVTKVASRRGRPKGSKNPSKAAPAKTKRVMTDEGKARIAAAQKK